MQFYLYEKNTSDDLSLHPPSQYHRVQSFRYIFETRFHPASDPQFSEFLCHAFLYSVTHRWTKTRKFPLYCVFCTVGRLLSFWRFPRLVFSFDLKGMTTIIPVIFRL